MYNLIFADDGGRFYDHPEIKMTGRTGQAYVEPIPEEMIPLPEGATLTLLPGKVPVGLDNNGQFVQAEWEGKNMWAVGALLPQGFTRTLLPAFHGKSEGTLPLYGYAAVGWHQDTVYVAAHPTDEHRKWNPSNYNTGDLAEKVEETRIKYKGNRVLEQLAKCALEYSCFTAQNIFYRRWEGGIPISPTCNARCVGCISEQASECCPAPQSRIDFVPTVQEIVEIAFRHLTEAEEAIISFGQGCEGEPALAAEKAAQAIKELRHRTSSGTVNMNTNGGYTKGIEAVCAAGIDSLRVSTISGLEKTYNTYYNPQNYSLADVRQSIEKAKENNVFVALNLLTFPGLTDREEEIAALFDLVDDMGIDMVQFRNLNIDPDLLMTTVPPGPSHTMGITQMIECLREEFPDLIIGSYSRPIGHKPRL